MGTALTHWAGRMHDSLFVDGLKDCPINLASWRHGNKPLHFLLQVSLLQVFSTLLPVRLNETLHKVMFRPWKRLLSVVPPAASVPPLVKQWHSDSPEQPLWMQCQNHHWKQKEKYTSSPPLEKQWHNYHDQKQYHAFRSFPLAFFRQHVVRCMEDGEGEVLPAPPELILLRHHQGIMLPLTRPYTMQSKASCAGSHE